MKVVGIIPKHIVIGVEFTPEELNYIRWFLDNASVDFNGENDFEDAAQKFVIKEFFPMLEGVTKELKDGSG